MGDAARTIYPGQHMSVYRCPDQDYLWHIGHLPQMVVQGKMPRRFLSNRKLQG